MFYAKDNTVHVVDNASMRVVQTIEVASAISRLSVSSENLLVQTTNQAVLFKYSHDAHTFLRAVVMPLFTSQSHLTIITDGLYVAIEN